MGHRRGHRRRRSPHRPRRPPLTEIYRPVASRVRANVRARIQQENTPAGEDRPVRNPLGVRVVYTMVVVPAGERSRWAGR